MNIKKRLRQEIKRTDEEILKRDEEFIREFKANYCAAPKPKTKRKILISFGSAFACVFCAVMLMLFLPNVGLLNKEKEFLEDNRVVAASTVEELNSDLDDIKLNVLRNGNYVVNRIYDKVYNENLWYEINVLNGFKKFYINIYVNRDFLDRKNVIDGKSKTINNIEYYVLENQKEDKYFDMAQFNIGDIGVYIEYSQTKLDSGQDEFFEFLEDLFTLK